MFFHKIFLDLNNLFANLWQYFVVFKTELNIDGVVFGLPLQVLTACVESISLMEWSYCSARMASFRVCSSFSLLSTALWSDLGVVSSRWFLRALYCLVWVLQVSWNCFLIWSSLDCRQKETEMLSEGVCVVWSTVSYRVACQFTFRLLGCCRTSMTCLRLNSLSLLLLYSSWLVSSVWCWVLISSARAFWIVPRCLNSSSCIDSWCLSSMACSRSFCVCRLFSSWKGGGNAGWRQSHQ